jgi:regulator of cell morphogenesis and NO signaling
MINKLAGKHGERHPNLVALHQVYHAFRCELESHMFKEERILFPMIREIEQAGGPTQSHCGSVRNPIRVMEHEHNDAGQALARMRELTDNYTPPADACATFRAFYAGLSELEADMHQHVHKENNILFPRAAAMESGATNAA